jgi:two-component system, NtrC family, sensor kinase
MQRPVSIRLAVVLLAISTLAATILACMNFVQESHFQLPVDGIAWLEAPGGLVAGHVMGPGQRAGIKSGDLLIAANNQPTPRISALTRVMFRTGPYGKATYTVVRDGFKFDATIILEPQDRSLNQGLRLVALVYLFIGLYVLFRRWTAPRSMHFYVFCLASFVLYAFDYTSQFDSLDWTVYWGQIIAGALQPALFVHFALAFPQERDSLHRKHWLVYAIYFPAALVVGLQITAIEWFSATELLRHRLDQIATGYQAFFYVLAALLLLVSYKRSDNPLRRQQLKWLTRGTLLSVVPFTLFNAIPFLLNIHVWSPLEKLAGVSLVFLPLTFSWAIIRYRLMDVDLIFKRGVTYTLATATLVGLYFGVVALAAEVVHKRFANAGSWGLIAAIVITAQLFDPLKRMIQDRVDRLFDRKRYDYRQTLIEFGRGLSSETDLKTLLHSIVDRLSQTLSVARVAVFFVDEQGKLQLRAAHGLPSNLTNAPETLALDFLDFDQPNAGSHLFLENTQQVLHLPQEERRTAAALDLNYYLPCRVQERTIAVIGLGRTTGGDFLSSEDVELLESLASYIGIAIQNARLYAKLEEKISEYEQLKEFNENIVESINVGILAVDLDDRIEGWNTQMEAMYALARQEAVGKRLQDVFPSEFTDEFHRVRNESGVHNLYKFRLTTRAGEIRTANIAIAPLLSRNFVALGRIILVDDITDRVELEAQLTQAEKLSSIGLLAAGVAHEVNTPLTVISSYTQMLAKQVRGDNRLGMLLEKITQQTFRASEIVNGLLNFSRTSGTEFREIDLNQIIHDTLVLLEHQFKTSQVQVHIDLQASMPHILGNPGKLQQVFLNLFLNAKDAMTGGGTLGVTTMCNEQACVTITDTGSGISPEHLNRIYDPFFTTKTAPRQGERRGTGLGLAVTYGIIQEHAGKIQVESQVGCGTTFHLEFPMVRKPAHA